MAGYSETPLFKKLGIKENFRLALINAPENFEEQLGELPLGVIVNDKSRQPLNLILFFTKKELELNKNFPKLAKRVAPAGMLWVAWPKKASGVTTDLSFDVVQEIGLNAGMVDTKICAVDAVWSGLRFVFRLKDRARMSEL
ncbi:MAG: hypothetical protein AUG51_16795 [Acidobacteria bacterium 13_1_20CM_3_53_8]|nr:MAG: hypothetical protein AUG51_16795 [Acidobacteria bacterium 13_1_20CM_3_53_8]